MKDTRRFLQYIGKYRFHYWLILIITLITESALQVLYSYVTKQTINAIEFQDMQMLYPHHQVQLSTSLPSLRIGTGN
jgi:hypothetical protein